MQTNTQTATPAGSGHSSRVIWITGAGSGVGAATARLFAPSGATLFLGDRNLERVSRLKDELAAFNKNVHASIGDLRDRMTAERTGALISEVAGRLDVLINCVGYNVPDRHWRDVDMDSIDSVVRTNLLAPFYCSKIALGFMRAQKAGTLVHVSSTDGLRVGVVGGPAYATSKHGLVALSHSINVEESRNGIRSCVICPGGIDTDFLDHRKDPPSSHERSRLLRPVDVAEAICYAANQPAHVRIEQITMTPAPS
jgi:NADP-dependent 3-hydroxy acid dehydrogenase YdfG